MSRVSSASSLQQPDVLAPLPAAAATSAPRAAISPGPSLGGVDSFESVFPRPANDLTFGRFDGGLLELPGKNIPGLTDIDLWLRGGIPLTAKAKTGLGSDVDAIVNKSSTLSKHVRELQKDGWSIKFGTAGGGTFANRNTKEIVIDANQKGSPLTVTQSLAHEVGHGKHTLAPYVSPSGLTKEEYIQRNINRHLRDEGAATFENLKARDEVKAKASKDIGVSGTQSAQYIAIYDDFKKGRLTQEEAITKLGALFGTGETTSTTGQTYNDYYGASYRAFWDANYSHLKAGERAP